MDDNFRVVKPNPGDARKKEAYLETHKTIFAIGDCAINAGCPLP